MFVVQFVGICLQKNTGEIVLPVRNMVFAKSNHVTGQTLASDENTSSLSVRRAKKTKSRGLRIVALVGRIIDIRFDQRVDTLQDYQKRAGNHMELMRYCINAETTS